MEKAQRATAVRYRHRRPEPGPQLPAASHSDALFATIYEQSQSVLGTICGFYIATYDRERDSVAIAYHIDAAMPRIAGTAFNAIQCDVIRERRPLINDNFARLLSRDAANSISVPLIRHGVVLGCFGAYSRHGQVYDSRDARALMAIAEIGAVALENARFLVEIEKARREAERLEEIGRAITGSLELNEVLHRVCAAATELIGADYATVWLTRGQDELEAAMTAGEIAVERGMVIPVPAVLRHETADLRKTYFVYADENEADHVLPAAMRNLAVARSTIAVALVAEERVLGALCIGHRERVHYTIDDVGLLERLSFQASIAVANAHLHEQIRALSMTDALTNMPNRRHLDMFLDKEFAAARRGRKLSVLLFDLDHFKEVNDRMGHHAGDALLQAFAGVLAAQTREMNLAARYGGDEFIIILADTDHSGAHAHAIRILREVTNNQLLAEAGVHASVGIASYDADMLTFVDLIRAADRDLYVRKNSRSGT